jgi:pyruvate-ferredoxin/flavodoxin oxidoreductase
VNTILQTCFFALTEILDRADAVERIKAAVEKSYGKRGRTVVEQNFAAIDAALEGMHEVAVPTQATGDLHRLPPVPEEAPDFVRRITSMMIAGEGDLLPVSALPVDGTFPTDTARWERRSIAHEIPIWDPEICIDCAKCALVCPHAAIRMKVYEPDAAAGAPESFRHKEWRDRADPGKWMTIQVVPDDCTGCGVCVDVCPARSKEVAKHKAIDMEPKREHLDAERASFDFFLRIPPADRRTAKIASIKGSQTLEPLFQASGACAGCGETPYLKLLSQMCGDRLLVANATGCSSIYGGNLPTTPWSRDAEGRGPAWSNSLFEDNAEFGLGMRLALDHQAAYARALLGHIGRGLDPVLTEAILGASQTDEAQLAEQRDRISRLKHLLAARQDDAARNLLTVVDALARKTVWIVGGDGWAYDIGFGGLDHVLASGRDVNLLVLDTQVYSNTGGQASKATPRGAVAKFAASGKPVGRKDLGLFATGYGNVYVAQVALGGDNAQTVKAFAEAESWSGPSLIIAYSTCIAHGIDMSTSMSHQTEAVRSGFWPTWRYDPRLAEQGRHPMQLDSRPATQPLAAFQAKEARFAMLARTQPLGSATLQRLAQADADERRRLYEQLAGLERDLPGRMAPDDGTGSRGKEVEQT